MSMPTLRLCREIFGNKEKIKDHCHYFVSYWCENGPGRIFIRTNCAMISEKIIMQTEQDIKKTQKYEQFLIHGFQELECDCVGEQ